MNKKIMMAIGMALLIAGCSSAPAKKTLDTDILLKADQAYRQGRLVDAEAYYLKIVDKNPTLYETWFRLGNIYVRTGQLDAAIRAFEKCIQLSPEKSKGWNNMALTRIRQAISTLEEGVGMSDASDPGYQQMSKLLSKLVSK
ncbi:tetratricopeptide repeat protein [Pelagibaculum spongiae]|nr:tetratricopeptide repeat protein [Pelagibaculum spongiae]